MKRKESLYTCCLGESDAARMDNYASDSSISYRGMKYYSFFFSSEYYIYVCNEGEQSQINQAKKGWMHHLTYAYIILHQYIIHNLALGKRQSVYTFNIIEL